MAWRDFGFYLRGRINSRLARTINKRRGTAPPSPVATVEEVIRGEETPLALSRLLEGRDNASREAAVEAYLRARGIPFDAHRFETFEGRGRNFTVDVGSGDRVLVVAAHHDAVPGSPGANDNAAAVGILLSLLPEIESVVPPSLRVRFLFPACEELGYLGAREYVKARPLDDITGVVSLELCGVGDTLAVWDAVEATPFLRTIAGSMSDLGLVQDETWHQVGKIPVFGSDHRAFADKGIPAYGLTVIPAREADALRSFVLSPVRSALAHAIRRPIPFDTYHTPNDKGSTLQPSSLSLVQRALTALISSVR